MAEKTIQEEAMDCARGKNITPECDVFRYGQPDHLFQFIGAQGEHGFIIDRDAVGPGASAFTEAKPSELVNVDVYLRELERLTFKKAS